MLLQREKASKGDIQSTNNNLCRDKNNHLLFYFVKNSLMSQLNRVISSGSLNHLEQNKNRHNNALLLTLTISKFQADGSQNLEALVIAMYQRNFSMQEFKNNFPLPITTLPKLPLLPWLSQGNDLVVASLFFPPAESPRSTYSTPSFLSTEE